MANRTLNKIEMILEWAEEHPEFDTSFVESLKSWYDRGVELSERQEEALDNIIEKFDIEDNDDD